jgi:hypothetical protein
MNTTCPLQCPISPFVRAYLECALWAECDGNDRPLEENYSVHDFAPEALEKAIVDCKRFQDENAADLAYYNHPRWTAAELGGFDLWLTRNHHGCGFWDRDDCLPEEARNRLTTAAAKMGESYVYTGNDGLLYLG